MGNETEVDWTEDVTYGFNVWFVNLGQTYSRSRTDGYIWAPMPMAGGKTFAHWESMKDVEQGDMILCYAQKEIMSDRKSVV
jgi:hypothetical protein